MIEKIDRCKNNSEKFFTAKIGEHISSSFLMPTISSFRKKENKHDIYIGNDQMDMFYKSLRKHAMKIIKFKKKEMKLLPNEQQKSHENGTFCYIYKEQFEDKYAKEEKYCKVRNHYHTGEYKEAAHGICNLVYLKKLA